MNFETFFSEAPTVLSLKCTRDKFKTLVGKAICRSTVLTIGRMRQFAKRQRRYILVAYYAKGHKAESKCGLP